MLFCTPNPASFSDRLLYRPPRDVVPIGDHSFLMNLRGALTGIFTLGDLERYFHIPLRNRPCCWSSLLGLYTPFTVAEGITLDPWHPAP